MNTKTLVGRQWLELIDEVLTNVLVISVLVPSAGELEPVQLLATS